MKKALAERVLNAEMDHHLGGEGEAGNGRNGYGHKTVPMPAIAAASKWFRRCSAIATTCSGS